MRAINIGGSTGLPYFRPPLETLSVRAERYEAQDIRIEGCTFLGSDAPCAFVGVDGAIVRYNTIYRPNRWAFRILQENNTPGFVPSRNWVLENNLFIFQSDKWVEGGVNIGSHTAPATFRLSSNWWYCEDRPARSRPAFPAPISESGGVYGTDPLLRAPAKGDLRLAETSPAAGKAGAEARQ